MTKYERSAVKVLLGFALTVFVIAVCTIVPFL